MTTNYKRSEGSAGEQPNWNDGAGSGVDDAWGKGPIPS